MTGDLRRFYADGARSDNDNIYKTPRAAHHARSRHTSTQPLGTFSIHWAILCTIGIMVSAWVLARLFVALVPLSSVVAQYSTPPVLPSLLDATADELISGLEAGDFTSLDLVQVSDCSLCPMCVAMY